jgi:hypothetical protein
MTDVQETVQERSFPKPVFTDAEAGAKEFPDSTARRYNYYEPAKRKQSHYEDVTVATRWSGPHSRPGAATGRCPSVGRVPAARATTGRRTAGTSSATPTRSGNSPSTATTPTSYGR